MKNIAIIGECMIELNGEPFGAMWQTYGGDTLNTATYLARVSLPEQVAVHYVSALGQDKLSQGILARWQADRLVTDLVLIDPKRSAGLYLIQLDQQGERTFLYWRNQSAARYLLQHPDFSRVDAALKAMDLIYLSGISLAILPEADRALLLEKLAVWKQHGVEIAFDSNFRPALWESLSQAQECYRALLPLVDMAFVTLDDEQQLWQDDDQASVLGRLTEAGIKTIVLKKGKEGALLKHRGQETVVATQAVKNVVDTTSAGDAFNAGFLQGYLKNRPLVECCQQGNALAGVVILHKGAIIPPAATAHLFDQFNKE